MRKLYYCTKCGNTKTGEKQCLICQSHDISLVPEKYISYIAEIVPVLNKDLEVEFIENVVKASPNFDAYWFEHKEDVIEHNKQQYEKVEAFQKEKSNVPKCPTCSSTNIKKISGTSKVASVAMFGLLSQKVKKQFHCNDCGYEW